MVKNDAANTTNLSGTMDELEIKITYKNKVATPEEPLGFFLGIQMKQKTPSKASSSASAAQQAGNATVIRQIQTSAAQQAGNATVIRQIQTSAAQQAGNATAIRQIQTSAAQQAGNATAIRQIQASAAQQAGNATAIRQIQARTPSFSHSAGSGVRKPSPASTAAVILRAVGATALLQRVGRPEPLTPNLRRTAINAIADHFVIKKIPLSISNCRNLESELLSLFPGEQESDYTVSGRSRMYVRYNNRKRLEKHHANIRRKLIWTPATTEPLTPKTSVASGSQTLPVAFDEVPDAREK
ncbi:uncharacterized protein [Drosophila pseudoobscura]|uniref:Uncharacterized protein n=1 Tax=Drosophila pseudoobscura pseudoobscura TaxID=46245 RepID=A0A6I8VAW3_DROPS|nr:uncharacterized protein LOC26534406 [Drosophila pseudoobscura]